VMQSYTVTALEKGFIALRIRANDPQLTFEISKRENIYVTPHFLNLKKMSIQG
ncbi:hypothetical protein ACINWC136_A0081, partial [Acinetobacter pittii]